MAAFGPEGRSPQICYLRRCSIDEASGAGVRAPASSCSARSLVASGSARNHRQGKDAGHGRTARTRSAARSRCNPESRASSRLPPLRKPQSCRGTSAAMERARCWRSRRPTMWQTAQNESNRLHEEERFPHCSIKTFVRYLLPARRGFHGRRRKRTLRWQAGTLESVERTEPPEDVDRSGMRQQAPPPACDRSGLCRTDR